MNILTALDRTMSSTAMILSIEARDHEPTRPKAGVT